MGRGSVQGLKADPEAQCAKAREEPAPERRRLQPEPQRLADPHTDQGHQQRHCALPRESALQNHLARHAGRLGVVLRLRVRVKGFDAICRMVEAGVGIAVVPEAAARRCRRSMAIDSLRIRDPWAERRLAVCVRRARQLSPPLRRLVDHLAQASERR